MDVVEVVTLLAHAHRAAQANHVEQVMVVEEPAMVDLVLVDTSVITVHV